MPDHQFVHIELSSRDLHESAKFYQALFGWNTQEYPEMNYVTFDTGGLGGGFNPISDGVPAGSVVIYVSTNDIDASLAQVEALGGSIVAPKMPVPGVGVIAWFKDLSGNLLALLQPADEM
ncbi:MAG: VOC family protein [Anaerolineales bacterium]|nr:VOC family protein [Anaerolineales bacterium]MCB8951422.1 VOC family protein [Ardenticatenales bacterium]